MPERIARTESPDPLDLLNGGEESSDEPPKRLREPPHTAPVLSKRPSSYARQRVGGGSISSLGTTSPSLLLANAGTAAKRASRSSSEESSEDEDDDLDRARDAQQKRMRTPASARPPLLHTPSAASSKSAAQSRRQTSPAKRSNRSSRSSSTVSGKRVVPPPQAARRAASPTSSDDQASDDDRRRSSAPPGRTPTRSPVKQLMSVVIPERPGIRRRASTSPSKTVRAPAVAPPVTTDLQLVNEAMEVDEAEVDAGARLGPIPAATAPLEQDIPLDMAPDWQFGATTEAKSEKADSPPPAASGGQSLDKSRPDAESEVMEQRLDHEDGAAGSQGRGVQSQEQEVPEMTVDAAGEPVRQPSPTLPRMTTEMQDGEVAEQRASEPEGLLATKSAGAADMQRTDPSPAQQDGALEAEPVQDGSTSVAQPPAEEKDAEDMEVEERIPDEPYQTAPASSGGGIEEAGPGEVQEAEEEVEVGDAGVTAPSEGEPEIDAMEVDDPPSTKDKVPPDAANAVVQVDSTPDPNATPTGKAKAAGKKAAAAPKEDGKEKGKAVQQKAKPEKKKEDNKPSKKAKLDKGDDSISATPRQSTPAPAAEVEDEGSCGVCGKAWDGEDDEETWIGCEGCDQWFCAGCSGLTAEQIDLVEVFICKTCERRTRQKTTWKVRCKYSECSNVIAGGPSKFCSSSCAFKHSALLLASIQNKKSIKQLGQDLAAFPAPSLGVSVVHHLPTPPASPSQPLDTKADGSKELKVEDSPLASMLEAITKQIESVKAAIQLVQRRQQILENVVARCETLPPLAGTTNGTTEPAPAASSKSSKKSSSRKGGASDDRPCGWERRLIWDDDAVLAAPEPPAPAAEEPGPDAAAVAEEDADRAPCLNPRRKCDRHTGWQKTVAALLENEAYQLDTELAGLQEERTTLENKEETLKASSTVRSTVEWKLAKVRKKA